MIFIDEKLKKAQPWASDLISALSAFRISFRRFFSPILSCWIILEIMAVDRDDFRRSFSISEIKKFSNKII